MPLEGYLGEKLSYNHHETFIVDYVLGKFERFSMKLPTVDPIYFDPCVKELTDIKAHGVSCVLLSYMF